MKTVMQEKHDATTDVVVAIANKILDVQRALDAFTYKRKQHLSCTVERTMQEIEQAFDNKRYAEAEHLIDIIHIQIAREAKLFAANPQKFIDKWKTIKETILIHEQPVMKRGVCVMSERSAVYCNSNPRYRIICINDRWCVQYDSGVRSTKEIDNWITDTVGPLVEKARAEASLVLKST